MPRRTRSSSTRSVAKAFADGKLEQLRRASGGSFYLFTSGQATELLASFQFWNDRLEGLRLLPMVDADNAAATLQHFAPAPSLTRSEAKRVLRIR